MRFIVTAGQRSDATQALALIDGLPAAHVIADKAYDAYAILNAVEASAAKPITPQHTYMSRTRDSDAALDKPRNHIERTIGRFKQLRRIFTRYDRIPANYLAGLYLASLSLSP